MRLWVNKVGPYNNPQETYNYYYLPFCKPDAGEKPAHKWGGLGEVLQGNELIDSQLDIKYRSAPRPHLTSMQQLQAADTRGIPVRCPHHDEAGHRQTCSALLAAHKYIP